MILLHFRIKIEIAHGYIIRSIHAHCAMLTGLLLWRTFCQPCDVMIKGMTLMVPLLLGTASIAKIPARPCSVVWVPSGYFQWLFLLKTVL